MMNPFLDESTPHDERISSIDMRDLPALQDDDTVDPDFQAHTLHVQIRATRSKNPMHKSNIRQAVPQPRRNSSPTGGRNHRRTASATQHSRNREPSRDTGHRPTVFPSVTLPDGSDRASSPDIATCIAATPRPRRRSGTSSTCSRSRSQSRRRTPKSLPGSCRTSAVGRLSVFSLPDEPSRRESEGSATLASRTLLAYTNKDDDGGDLWHEGSLVEDYGVVIRGGDGDFTGVPDEEDTAGDSDSSLDLHTPLPSLMLREGMLSPHSKLLPQNIHADAPVVATDGSRHGSVSNSMTKLGVFKDDRDTIRRRVRHRDGRLLRGGIGLTTGLGWSDSEDEDAPSDLTRRLSHLALSRISSTPTAKTVPRTSRSHPHSLSRSYSGDAKVHLSKSTQNMRRPTHPPTSWPKRNPTVVSTLSLSIPEHDPPEPVPSLARFSEPPSSRVDIHADSQPNDQVRTPSTSSTQSLPGPVTPDVMDILPHNAAVKSWDRDKSLPPLPLSRVPSLATLRPMGSLSDMKSHASRIGAPPSTRPISSGSELSDSAGMPLHSPKIAHGYTASTLPSRRTTPRPLQLSASFGADFRPGEPASKQGLLLGYNRQLHDQQRARALSGQPPSPSSGYRYSGHSMTTPGLPQSGSMDPSLSEMGELRLRPRTGTGMAYKKSPMSLTRAAADVQAQSRIRMTSERTGPVAL
ncbi:hypothetical protein BJV78DRAFT_268849 [Lactifluus subvellereus]|nr:hypothetical protein BJV78DRAFT_268849 [Lactifluus subvellereus]